MRSLGADTLVPHRIPIQGLTSFKIGGVAENVFIIHTIDELGFFFNRILPFYNGRFFILGGGSNILVDSRGIKTPVLKLGEEFSYIHRLGEDIVAAGASTSLSSLLRYTIYEGLSGLETFSGIPASVGGLSVMNASAFGCDFSTIVEKVKVMDYEGTVMEIPKEKIEFCYRGSSLSRYVVLEVHLRFKKDSSERVRKNVGKYLRRRLVSQDFSYPSAGSVFKNHPQYPAGVLIERIGFKGLMMGGACISTRHANFILNRYNATSDDVKYIIDLVKERVYHRWGVMLEEEIITWQD